jgi:hypothetical protein
LLLLRGTASSLLLPAGLFGRPLLPEPLVLLSPGLLFDCLLPRGLPYGFLPLALRPLLLPGTFGRFLLGPGLLSGQLPAGSISGLLLPSRLQGLSLSCPCTGLRLLSLFNLAWGPLRPHSYALPASGGRLLCPSAVLGIATELRIGIEDALATLRAQRRELHRR